MPAAARAAAAPRSTSGSTARGTVAGTADSTLTQDGSSSHSSPKLAVRAGMEKDGPRYETMQILAPNGAATIPRRLSRFRQRATELETRFA
jgi:hypothetical protein